MSRALAFRLNFEEAFRCIGRDRAWVQKLLLGGLFSLLSLVVIGGILVQGYLLVFAARVSRGEEEPLPVWENYGELFRWGVLGYIVAFVYCLPLILLGVLSFLLFLPLIFAGATSSQVIGQITGMTSVAFVLLWLVFIPLVIAISVIIPAAYAQLVLHDGDLAAAFRRRAVFGFIGRYRGQYALLTILSYAASSLLSQVGYIACFVGIFVTVFVAQLFQYHLIGQLCWYERTVVGVAPARQ